ncbi:1-phosphofructokinase family hexose kinase [Aristaeella lactis]|uniref:Fructose-1-phosphate kinase n=1 Tax=Aristaeella lactis TaxID=3046383 RepID=A0AC61PIE4_9FIRM|nr:1-phosphofructokinase family hexose kinase [Aristaeella lactis]QUA53723.1 1-phosphofructokinase family hexose kinase [Aristaeella lactis]SMC38793.1 fructose-1-phosphate kinase [Aristaeella lactis]
MITTICLNPCFDKTVNVENLQTGQVNRIRDTRVDLGGKGINVAVVASRLGLDVQCIGIMGENGSTELTAMMDREGLKHRFMTVPGHVRTNMKVYSLDGQGVTELNEPGSPLNPEMLEQFTAIAEEATRDSNMIVMTGSLPPGCPEGTYRNLMKALEGKKCILDTEGRELEMAAKGGHPFLIKPNLREMEATLGIELRTMRAIRDAALLFIRLGVQHSVVSMGAMGAMYISAEKTLFAPALRVETKSTVGAGDAMIGGMLLGYEVEKDMAKAFRYGIAAGAASVMTEGTQLIVRSDFEKLLDQVRIQEV